MTTAIITAVIVTIANYYSTQLAFKNQTVLTQKRDAYIRALKVVNQRMRYAEISDAEHNVSTGIDKVNFELLNSDANESFNELALFSSNEIVKAYIASAFYTQSTNPVAARGQLIELMREDLGLGKLNLDDKDELFLVDSQRTKTQKTP